jgi:hypothetical protein
MQLLPYLRKHTAVTMLKNRVMVKGRTFTRSTNVE